MRYATELEWLTYFYENVTDCLGPAEDDIVAQLKEDFSKDTNLKVPKEYE